MVGGSGPVVGGSCPVVGGSGPVVGVGRPVVDTWSVESAALVRTTDNSVDRQNSQITSENE